MKFQNTNAGAELNFSVLGEAYKVAPGGEVDIDPAHVPWVLRRGLQLEPVMFKPKAPKAPKPEAPKPAAPKVEKPAEPKAPVATAKEPVKPETDKSDK